jgi:hypothetical protein
MAALAQQAILCPILLCYYTLCPIALCPNIPPSWRRKSHQPRSSKSENSYTIFGCASTTKGWGCRPPNDLFPCNFAHWLKDLNVPEEYLGEWSKVWQQGNVDMCFWPNYTPNQESLKRFTRQFLWEQSVHPHELPNRAWGHALKIGLITEEKSAPEHPEGLRLA